MLIKYLRKRKARKRLAEFEKGFTWAIKSYFIDGLEFQTIVAYYYMEEYVDNPSDHYAGICFALTSIIRFPTANIKHYEKVRSNIKEIKSKLEIEADNVYKSI